MFSYKINNPNNFSIDVKGDYYAIPFGQSRNRVQIECFSLAIIITAIALQIL